MTTEDTNIKCKKCGENCIKVTVDNRCILRPRRISYCKGYHLNAFNDKTKICTMELTK